MAKKTRMKPEARTHQIVAAGCKLIRENGYKGLTVRGVAEAVGVSHAAVLYHFRTLAQLRRAVMRHAITREDALVIAMGVEANDRHAAGASVALQARGAEQLKEWDPCLSQ